MTSYKKFVKEGIGEESVLKKSNERVVLGGGEFIKKAMACLNREGLEEIPRKQRFADRPGLPDLLGGLDLQKANRNRKIAEAVRDYGYSQRELAGFLDMHYSTISRIIKNEETSRFKT